MCPAARRRRLAGCNRRCLGYRLRRGLNRYTLRLDRRTLPLSLFAALRRRLPVETALPTRLAVGLTLIAIRPVAIITPVVPLSAVAALLVAEPVAPAVPVAVAIPIAVPVAVAVMPTLLAIVVTHLAIVATAAIVPPVLVTLAFAKPLRRLLENAGLRLVTANLTFAAEAAAHLILALVVAAGADVTAFALRRTLPELAVAALLHLLLLAERHDDPIIVLGVLQIRLGEDGVSGRLRIASKRHVFLGYMCRIAADLHVRAI